MKTTYTVDGRFKEVKLRSHPVTIQVEKFNSEAAREFSSAMAAAHNTGQEIIPIVINSPGGEVYSLMAMISEIKNSELPVATIVEGKAMSCGAVLFTFGADGHRYMAPDATVMIHDVSSGGRGKIEELKADVKEADRLDEKIFKMMAQNCGKKDDFFKKKVFAKKHADWFLDADECKKHNICNHIRIPTVRVEAKLDIVFE
jgi:ATP-dependent Clp endopeptidase proteolytic subunit ClpP